MSFLAELDRYLAVRRQPGADLRTDERILRRFVTFADRDEAQYVSTSLIMRWLESLPSANPGTRATRFRVARQFAEWLHGLDPRHEAPPRGLVPGRVQRVHPYIYSDAEIVAIIEHARKLPSVYGIRGLTCSTLFGLIAVTGLRISEALGLDPADCRCCRTDRDPRRRRPAYLDVESGMLHVRQVKLGKERLLPLDPSVVLRPESYGRERNRLLGRRPEAFFVTCEGHRLGDCGARYNFAHVCQ
jgi:integrase/recombinase XerD